MLFKKNKRDAFTLLELMVVIAIIGILAGMAVPSFKKARLSANWRACQTNMSTLQTAIDSACAENDYESLGSAGNIKEIAAGGKDGEGNYDIGETEQKWLKTNGYLKKLLHCPYGKVNDSYNYVMTKDGTSEMHCKHHDAYQSDKRPKKFFK